MDNNVLKIIAGLFLLFIILWLSKLFINKKYKKVCSECAIGSIDDVDPSIIIEDTTLLPIFDPAFNFRETSKQLLLLEDHLFNQRKFCKDCCRKHLLTAEGLAEEASSLDKEQKYKDICNDLPEKIREIITMLSNGVDRLTIAQKVRDIRKPLHIYFYDKF